ncbi:hypothetical protein PSP6_440121 [Paraburkholderia tropica]|nr:hypothetical protein PSP6_440121 [Paraburkholderia tropica]
MRQACVKARVAYEKPSVWAFQEIRAGAATQEEEKRAGLPAIVCRSKTERRMRMAGRVRLRGSAARPRCTARPPGSGGAGCESLRSSGDCVDQ